MIKKTSDKEILQQREGKIPESFKIPEDKKPEVIYVFQGGGALGAYQVGTYEALAQHGYAPDMIVGISIGAINSALIAGNKPEERLIRLTQFWERITTKMPFPAMANLGLSKFHHFISAQLSLICGQPGFFSPKLIPPHLILDETPDKISFYDTAPLRETLLELIDFEYLNAHHVRLCLGSVDLESGEFIFFDSSEQEITVKHIMASAALPPGFPPVKIAGRYYVDGGVFSNTPLSKVIDEFADTESEIRNILCFMVDLFSLKGTLPHSLDGLMERIKDIRYSSHTKRANSVYATTQNLSHAIHFLGKQLTAEQKKDPQVKEILNLGLAHRMNIVHLIYRSEKGTELESKDYEFSTETASKHRSLGYNNTTNMIQTQEETWMKRHRSGVTVYTLEAESAVANKL